MLRSAGTALGCSVDELSLRHARPDCPAPICSKGSKE